MNGECSDTQSIPLTSHSRLTSAFCRMRNNQPKELITSEVYHMFVTTNVEQSGWMTGGVWTK